MFHRALEFLTRPLPTATALKTWGLIAIAFASIYITISRVGPASLISAHADFSVSPPMLYRFLMPVLLDFTLPRDWIDTAWLRASIAAVFFAVSVALMAPFAERVLGHQLDASARTAARWGLALVLIAHYLMPRQYKFYYVYDLPAVAFYLAAFLSLTSARATRQWLALPLIAVAGLNRETVIVAALHACVHLWLQSSSTSNWWQPTLHRILCVAPAVLGGVAVLAVKALTVQWLGHEASSTFSAEDEGRWRIVSNLVGLSSQHQQTLALLWFGAGALIWIPRQWKQLPTQVRQLMLVSLLPLVLLCVVGNVAELRMFSEFTPVLGLGLSIVLMHRRQPAPAASSI